MRKLNDYYKIYRYHASLLLIQKPIDPVSLGYILDFFRAKDRTQDLPGRVKEEFYTQFGNHEYEINHVNGYEWEIKRR